MFYILLWGLCPSCAPPVYRMPLSLFLPDITKQNGEISVHQTPHIDKTLHIRIGCKNRGRHLEEGGYGILG